MKVFSWIIVLLGLWVFGDIAALFVSDFGRIPGYLWNHIAVGFVLMLAGVWAARTGNARTARTLNWAAAGAGGWLVVSSFVLRYPDLGIGLWNDLIVGGLACVTGVWAALASSREVG
jgi:hypothetical protein